MPASLQLALLSCALLGLRHGFDYDHLAAITDITSVQRGWREGMRLGLLYALGHALTVALLGSAVLFLHLSLPARLDAIGERLVGATLIILAIYVLVSFLRRTASPTNRPAPRSRIALLVSGARYLHWRLYKLARPHAPEPEPFAFRYDRSSVFTVGIIHGLGAETPSQLLLFLLAANLGGTSRGFFGLFSFVVGLLVMNTLMTASASGIFAGSRQSPWLQTFVTSLTALYSLAIGIIFFFGIGDRLPQLAH